MTELGGRVGVGGLSIHADRQPAKVATSELILCTTTVRRLYENDVNEGRECLLTYLHRYVYNCVGK